jgi:hypothetical protein
MNQPLKDAERTCNVTIRAIQDDATIAGNPENIYGAGMAREMLSAGFGVRGNETHPDKATAYGRTPEDRAKIPACITQPFYTITDETTGQETKAYGIVTCGAPIGDADFVREWLHREALTIAEKIDEVSKKVSSIDPHSCTAITVYSLQSLADYILATNLPSEVTQFVAIVDAAIERAHKRGHGIDLLDPTECHPKDTTPTDVNFISDRSKLRASRGGAAIRCLSDRHLFLNSICNVIPQFLDRTDKEGSTTPGLFPHLATVLGVGSFNAANSTHRWAPFIASGSAIASEFVLEYNKCKTEHSTLVDSLALPHGTKRPESIFDTPIDGFGEGIKKVHKKIQDELQELRFRCLTQRAATLPCTDARRKAFFANSTDQFACKLLGNLPHPEVSFTPSEWTTSVAIHMGVPVAALRSSVGATIHNNSNSPYTSVDPFGYKLTTVAGIEGGGTQRNHNTTARAISSGLSKAGISHLGGATDRSCKSIFRGATPPGAANDGETVKQLNSIIADLVIFTRHIEAPPLGGKDHIVDVKTLAAGLCYETNSTTFNHAVTKRQAQVGSDYLATASKLDARLHNTPIGIRGPFTSTIFEYGHDGRVLGPVVGVFGEASEDLGNLRNLIAHELAAKHQEYYRMTVSQSEALYKHQLNRKWGHTIARGWSRLILDRLRDHVGHHTADAHRSSANSRNEAHEQHQFFNNTGQAGPVSHRQ